MGLDTDEDSVLSLVEWLQVYLLRLPPRKVFLALASLTVLAGGLAGFMAYRTLHPNLPRFNDLEPAAQFGVASPASQALTSPADQTIGQAAPTPAAAQPTTPPPATLSAPVATPKPVATHTPIASASRPKHTLPVHQPEVAVWPPAREQMARDTAQPASVPAPTVVATASATQPASAGPLYVPAPTMIGYSLATPQPAYPTAQAHGVSGTVSVEITVSRRGDVTSARAVSGPQELRAAAVSAVRGWRFRPYLVDGKATEVSTTLQFFFRGE